VKVGKNDVQALGVLAGVACSSAVRVQVGRLNGQLALAILVFAGLTVSRLDGVAVLRADEQVSLVGVDQIGLERQGPL